MGSHDLTPRFKNLGEWIRHEFREAGQGGLAKKLKPKVSKNAISMWNTGKNRISPDYQDQIRALGYDGPWPQEAAESPGPPATSAEVSELRSALRDHIEQWEQGQQKVLERLEALARKLGIPGEGDP